jgi:hypothetical protein
MKSITIVIAATLCLTIHARSQENTPWQTTGNIGIGTTAPVNRLDVAGKIGVSNGIIMTGVPTNLSDVNYLQGTNSSTTIGLLAGTGVFSASSGPNMGARGNTYTAIPGQRGIVFLSAGAVSGATGTEGSILFFTSPGTGNEGEVRMIVDRNGHVGIGTTNTHDAAYKLFVATGIRTRKVKVDQATWPDYVFDACYRLRPLSEVAQYIQQHKHLPDVPSAAEIQERGLDLGDTQATLLKKMEELTLYLLEQNKKLEEQQKEIDDLKKQLNNK